MIIAPTFAKEVIKQFMDTPKHSPWRGILCDLAGEIESAQKFILPQGGRFVDDPDYKAIEKGDELRLPFTRMVLEFKPAFTNFKPDTGYFKHEKTLVLCAETDTHIMFSPVFFFQNKWTPLPPAFLSKTLAISYDRDAHLGPRRPIGIELCATPWFPVSADDYLDEAIAIVSMINALACKNVAIHKEKCSRYSNARMQAKDCDEYHMLVLTNSVSEGPAGASVGIRRGVREHLRRGHVRICASGVKTWVNAAVIAKGNGGKVIKDYLLK